MGNRLFERIRRTDQPYPRPEHPGDFSQQDGDRNPRPGHPGDFSQQDGDRNPRPGHPGASLQQDGNRNEAIVGSRVLKFLSLTIIFIASSDGVLCHEEGKRPTTSSASGTTDTGGLSTDVMVALGVGIVTLAAIILVSCCMKKRHNNQIQNAQRSSNAILPHPPDSKVVSDISSQLQSKGESPDDRSRNEGPPMLTVTQQTPTSPQGKEETQMRSDQVEKVLSAVDNTPLGEEDRLNILNEMIPVVGSWKAIGTGLGIDSGRLDAIQVSNFGNPKNCLLEMLICWLRRNYNVERFGEPTWQAVVKVVARPAAGDNCALALTIAGNHPATVVSAAAPPNAKKTPFRTQEGLCTKGQEDLCASSGTSDDVFTFEGVSSSPGLSSPSQRDRSQRPSFGCGCGNCTFLSYIEHGCPEPIPKSTSFPYLNVSGLTHEQQKKLRSRLRVESREIIFKFQQLLSTVYKSLCEHKVTVNVLVTHLLSLGALDPVSKHSQKPLLQTFFQELRTAGSIEDVLWVIKDYFSFFNYHVIEHIVYGLGTGQDRTELQNYKEHFHRYSKRRIFECPPVYGPMSSRDHADLVLKVDSAYEQFTVEELENFEYKLSRTLHVTPQSVLRLCKVEEGCLQLIFQVPSFVQQVIFPLSSEQERALAAEGVIKLTCGDYQFAAKGDEDGSEPEETGAQHPHEVTDVSEVDSTPLDAQRSRDAIPPHPPDSKVVSDISSLLQSKRESPEDRARNEGLPMLTLNQQTATSPQGKEEMQMRSDQVDKVLPNVDDTPLGHEDHFDILTEMMPIASTWKAIGRGLRIEPGRLEIINENNSGKPKECLSEMLTCWLNRNYNVETFGEPTWRAVVKVVAHTAAGDNHALALRIAGKHSVGSATASQTTKKPPLRSQEDLCVSEPLTSKGATVSPGPISTTQDEETQNTIKTGPTSVTSSFPYLKASGLTPEQQEGLKIRLCVESEDMVRKFGHLRSRVYESLCERNVPVDKLVTHLLSLGAFDPVHMESQKPALQTFFQELRNARSIEDVLYIIRNCISFFNYHVIEHIVNELGTDQDRAELQNYERDFNEYSKRRVCECPPEYGPKSDADHVNLVVKKASVYEEFTVKELKKFEYRLSRIFCVTPPSVLRLCRVEEGCLQLIFQVPSFVQQEIFPLSSEQESALAAEGVIRLTCGDYQFSAKGDEDGSEPEDTGSDQVDKVLPNVDDTPLEPHFPSPMTSHWKEKREEEGAEEEVKWRKEDEEHHQSMRGKATSSFPHLKESGLTPEQQERLRIRLCVESEDIVHKFWRLHSRVYKSLCKQNVSVDKLVTHLLSLGAFDPVHKESQKPALQTFFQELRNAKSIEDVLYIIRDCISFFNYHVIEHIVNELGTDQDRVELQNYEKEFDQYSKRRVYECPTVCGSKSDAGHVDLVMKVDSVYEDFTLKELKKFQYRLSTILHISPSVLRLCQVEEGCLQLIFQIPSFVQQEIFPLCSEQESALAAEGVIRLTCGDYQFTAKGDENGSEPEDTEPVAELRVFQAELTVPDIDADSAIWTCSSIITDDRSSCRFSDYEEDPLSRELDEERTLQSSSGLQLTGSTPELHLAARRGDLERVKFLIDNEHQNPLQKDEYGNTALHAVARGGSLDILKYFIDERNCNPACLGQYGRTPLHVATDHAHLDAVKYLVTEHQVEPLCQDENRWTPLHLCCVRGGLDIVKFLTEEIEKYEPMKDLMPSLTTKMKNTPLHIAAQCGHLDIVRFFITDVKCSPNIPGKSGRHPLHYAAERGHLHIVKYLIDEQGCDPSCLDGKKETPLHCAAAKGRLDIVKFLTLEKHCNPTSKNSRGTTPIHWAAHHSHLEILKFFITNRTGSQNILGQFDRTPLHSAADGGCLHIVKYLTDEQGCEPSCLDINKQTPLHRAAQKGFLDVVKFLTLEKHCDPNQRDIKKNTSLHTAAKHGHREVVQFLVEELKCPNIRGEQNGTPLQLAEIKGHHNVALYLQKFVNTKGYFEVSKSCREQQEETQSQEGNDDMRPPSDIAKELGVQFIDPMEILSCDTHGRDYYNSRHDVRLKIPEGAILPGEGCIDIEFGVAMYGPFKLADGMTVRRISPIVWLCVQKYDFSGFQKDVEITIPHFLDFSSQDSYRYLRFLKASHQREDGETEYQLKKACGKVKFDTASYGTLLTRHFCSTCIASSVCPNEFTKYYLLGTKQKTKAQEWQITFFVCYFLKSCIETVKERMDEDSEEIYRRKFKFSDKKKIEIRVEIPGFQHAINPSKEISSTEVDFQEMTQDDLKLSEQENLYPPRFVAEISGTGNSKAVFTFEGAIETIKSEVLLMEADRKQTTSEPRRRKAPAAHQHSSSSSNADKTSSVSSSSGASAKGNGPLLLVLLVVIIGGVAAGVWLLAGSHTDVLTSLHSEPRTDLPPSDSVTNKENEQASTRKLDCHLIEDVSAVRDELRSVTDWKTLGEELQVPRHVLENIDSNNPKAERKIIETIHAWFNIKEKPCWEMVVRVLKRMLLKKLANEIAGRHGVNYNEV